MYCKVCGSIINTNDQVCPKCGTVIEKIEIFEDDNIVEGNLSQTEKTDQKVLTKKSDRHYNKKLLLFSIIILIILIIGVSASIYYLSIGRFTITTCIKNDNVSNSFYKLRDLKKIYRLKEQVYKIESIETVISDKKEFISYYEELYHEDFKNKYDKLKYVKYKVRKSKEKIVAKYLVDFSKENYYDNGEFSTWLKNGKISYNTIIEELTNLGFKCK